MSEHRHRAGRFRSARASLALGAVGVLAGLLFATNAGLFASATERQPQNLRDLVRAENEQLQEVGADVTELRGEVEALLTEQSRANPETSARPEVALAAGRTAVEGPGVTVQLWDAPSSVEPPSGFRADDLVVHQQDIEAVVNGLRAGGAEAVAVQGHRVTSTTSIRCVGNVLLVDGATYSPPYEVSAIGDPERLSAAVLGSSSVQVYLQYVDAVRLGWSLEQDEHLQIEGFEGNLTLEHARVPGQEPFVEVVEPMSTEDGDLQ